VLYDFPIRLLLAIAVPIATRWVSAQERRILTLGVALTESQRCDAERAGIRHADRVRLLVVDSMPWPVPRMFHRTVERLGLYSPHTIGLTMGHGIFLRSDYAGDRRLIVHEMTHTAQYERLGGIKPFLRAYLKECLIPPGYPFGALEQEAHIVAAKVCDDAA